MVSRPAPASPGWAAGSGYAFAVLRGWRGAGISAGRAARARSRLGPSGTPPASAPSGCDVRAARSPLAAGPAGATAPGHRGRGAGHHV